MAGDPGVDEELVLVDQIPPVQLSRELAATEEHHQSLRQEFPNMRSIRVLGKKVTGWQVLPADAPDFEEVALRACELIAAKDPRIGKVPKVRRPAASKRAKVPGRTAKSHTRS